jgi:hypothetical protein
MSLQQQVTRYETGEIGTEGDSLLGLRHFCLLWTVVVEVDLPSQRLDQTTEMRCRGIRINFSFSLSLFFFVLVRRVSRNVWQFLRAISIVAEIFEIAGECHIVFVRAAAAKLTKIKRQRRKKLFVC